MRNPFTHTTTEQDSRPTATERRRERKLREAANRVPRPGPRGWTGRGRGASTYVEAPDEFRGTTVQVCGLWPFSVGSSTPMVGVPFGRHLDTGATVCCDPVSWFQRAKLISNPSVFFFSNPGLGKSSAVGRMMIGLAAYGTIPMVLGDVKPDHVQAVRALGGKVIPLGHGRGYLNVLDASEAHEAADRLKAEARRLEADGEHARAKHLTKLAGEILADARARRRAMVTALLTISRNAAPTDREETIVEHALRLLDERHAEAPLLADLLALIEEGPEELRRVALDRGKRDRYEQITDNLQATLIGLTSGGRLGEIFSKPTTERIEPHRPVAFDISSIDDSEPELRAAALLACWSVGFGTINIANALAEAKLEPQRHYFVVMDELWQALRVGHGIVKRVDSLTRLNRKYGVGIAYVSHTMSDLLALPSEEDRNMARGLVARSGMVVLGGLAEEEMPLLTQSVPLSRDEQRLIQGWQSPPSWDPKLSAESEPPGRGRFLIKVRSRPGIPVRVMLTREELDVYNSNALWDEQSTAGRLFEEAV